MRKVQPANRESKGPLLPQAPPGLAPRNGSLGIFGPARADNGGRNKTPVEASVSDGSFDGSIRSELERLMRLPVAELHNTPAPDTTSSGAMLARILLKKAVVDEQQNAIIEVLDRIEGKATKASANKPSNNALVQQLEMSLESLNSLTENE